MAFITGAAKMLIQMIWNKSNGNYKKRLCIPMIESTQIFHGTKSRWIIDKTILLFDRVGSMARLTQLEISR